MSITVPDWSTTSMTARTSTPAIDPVMAISISAGSIDGAAAVHQSSVSARTWSSPAARSASWSASSSSSRGR
jgi:hypothetical protein